MSRRYAMGVVLSVALLFVPAFASGSPPAGPPVSASSHPEVVPSDAAARIYLAQALASLGRAEQLAQQASQYGDVGSFDVERFLGELRTISRALQRFLIPGSPEPGPEMSVEITGQYLYDALARRRQPATPPAVPQKESPPP